MPFEPCDTKVLAATLPVTAAFLGAHHRPTELHLALAFKAGGLLVEWPIEGDQASLTVWHTQCVKLEDVLHDERHGRSHQQIILPSLPNYVYAEIYRTTRAFPTCRSCTRSILVPPPPPLLVNV
jgi:hypothetical protein